MRLRTLAKEALYGLAYGVGAPRFIGSRVPGDLVVVTYHSFGPAAEHAYLHRQPVGAFRAQLRYLCSTYEMVSLEEGLSRVLNGHVSSVRPMVAVTIDDGYVDNYTHAFPVLLEFQVPATIFLATDYLDSGRLPWPTRISALLHAARAGKVTDLETGDDLHLKSAAERRNAGRRLREIFAAMDASDREAAFAAFEDALDCRPLEHLPPLTWDMVRRMRSSGVHFGAHTHFHGWLDCVSFNDCEADLAIGKARLEAETSALCEILAYPNGNWNASVARAAERAGFRFALTQDNGVNSVGAVEPFALKRIEIPYNEGLGTIACRVAGLAR